METSVILRVSLRVEALGSGGLSTLPETNMATQKGPYKDYSPTKRGLYGFPFWGSVSRMSPKYRKCRSLLH